MISYIYKSSKQDEMYLYLTKKDDFSDIPEALMTSMGKLQWVMALKLEASRKLARADVEQVMSQLEEKGYYLQMPPPPLNASEEIRQ